MIFDFHENFTKEDKEVFIKAQESDLISICNYLKTESPLLNKIIYNVYDRREGKQNADPNHSISRASARFKEMAIYRFWTPPEDSHFPHEITHLVAHTWVKPYIWETELDTWDEKRIKRKLEMVSTSFMQEGLAIAVDDIVFKRKLTENGESKLIDDWCRDQLDKMSKSLTEVINIDGFGSIENKIVVPFSASLSKYLLLTYGIDKYKEMYAKLKETQSEMMNVEVIEQVYGAKETNLMEAWRTSLTKN